MLKISLELSTPPLSTSARTAPSPETARNQRLGYHWGCVLWNTTGSAGVRDTGLQAKHEAYRSGSKRESSVTCGLILRLSRCGCRTPSQTQRSYVNCDNETAKKLQRLKGGHLGHWHQTALFRVYVSFGEKPRVCQSTSLTSLAIYVRCQTLGPAVCGHIFPAAFYFRTNIWPRHSRQRAGHTDRTRETAYPHLFGI